MTPSDHFPSLRSFPTDFLVMLYYLCLSCILLLFRSYPTSNIKIVNNFLVLRKIFGQFPLVNFYQRNVLMRFTLCLCLAACTDSNCAVCIASTCYACLSNYVKDTNGICQGMLYFQSWTRVGSIRGSGRGSDPTFSALNFCK